MKRVQIGIQNYKLKFNKSYNGELFAVQGDTGRIIKVQVVDELDTVVNIAGLSLEFYIGNAEQVSMVTGTIEDAINGIFKIEVVSGQLIHPGLQQAQFVLKDANGKVGSKLIDIWIEESIENGATTGRNVILDFSVFDEAVALLRELDFSTARELSETLATQVADANAFQASFAQNVATAGTVEANLTSVVQSAQAVDGVISTKINTIDGWIANPEQFKGEKGEDGINATTTAVATTTTNGLMSSADKTKLNELNYTRAMTQAQYDALSTSEKNRTDVWYGIYKV